MKYVRYTIKTLQGAEDIIAALLSDLNVEGVEIEDASLPEDIKKNGTFYDVLPENNIEGDNAFVSFYIEKDRDKDSILSDVGRILKELRETMDIGDGGISVSETEDKDWINNWKEFFKSFTIDFEDGKKAFFTPSWEKEEADGSCDYTINIDPGTAFGTGAHESTRLCIRALEKYVKKGIRFLDIGAGSGILSLLSFMFGAGSGMGVDIDEGSVSAVHDNFEKNGLSDAPYHLVIGNFLEDRNVRDHAGGMYDLIVANILPEVLIPLTGYIPEMLKDGGLYIVSGIIETKAESMRKCLEFNDFRILEENHDGEWVSFVTVFCADEPEVSAAEGVREPGHQFFVDPSQIRGNDIIIEGADFNHIKNVLRMKPGECVNVSDGLSGKEMRCHIESFSGDRVNLKLDFIKEADVELPVHVTLFQGLPKAGKMDFIIEKCVELGVSEIVPVMTERSVVKIDAKKAEGRVSHWQGKAEAAAKQSKRARIPEVGKVVSFKEALRLCEDYDHKIIPYELSRGFGKTRDMLRSFEKGSRIAVFIGPEGGFSEEEIALAKEKGVFPLTLGKRILRTETAGMVVLSWLIYFYEEEG